MPATNPFDAPPTPSRRPSALAVALGLAAVALVAAGAAWAGYTGRAAPTSAAPSAAPASESPTADALPPDAQALLDAGNAAFRAGRLEAALDHYRAAAARAPRHAAPWFGVHMVAQKLGRRALADSAQAAVRARTGEPVDGGGPHP